MNVCLLIFITLAIEMFDVKADMLCIRELVKAGKFHVEQNKIQAFMHAYNNLIIPFDFDPIRTKGILYSYHRELLTRFLEVHQDNMPHMFQKPMTWCMNILKYTEFDKKSGIPFEFKCRETMNNMKVPDLSEYSQKTALEVIFTRLKLNYKQIKEIKVMQRNYIEYVGRIIKKYVEYTNTRGPVEYCNSIESPPLYLLFFDQYGMPKFSLNADHTQTLAHPSTVNQNEIINFVNYFPYSSAADREIFVLIADMTWKELCIKQLNEIVGSDMKYNKTQVFMRAYNHLIIPNDEHIILDEAILHVYQRELLQRYLEAHKNNLQYMFQRPMDWCIDNVDILGRNRDLKKPKKERCKKFMNNKKSCRFNECSQAEVLEHMFLELRLSMCDNKELKVLQCSYFKYVGKIVEKYVDYTYVRIPSNYCNDINSSPKYFIKIYENGSSQLSKNLQYNITLDQLPFVSQDDIFDIVDQTASSSALDKGKGPLID